VLSVAFIYSTAGEKIHLTPSLNDIGVRFKDTNVAKRAVRALIVSAEVPAAPQRVARTIQGHAPVSFPRRYEQVMLMNDLGVAAAPMEGLVNALSRKFANKAESTYPVYVDDRSGLRVVCTEEITVRFKPKVTAAQRSKLLCGLGLEIDRPDEFVGHQFQVLPTALTFKSGFRSIDLANELREADDLVEFAAPNFVSEHRKSGAPNDPLFAQEWHLNNLGKKGGLAGEDVQALAAWQVTRGRRDIVIAIIDDGVDLFHPDLRANLWTNPDSKAPDQNGRNFYDDTFDPSPQYFHAPFDQLEGNDIHGTPCAGVAAAVGNNRKGVAGIAYGCRILPVKIFGADALAPNDRVADSIRYAAQYAQVISCSWSGPAANPDLEAAIDDVVTTGREGRGTLLFCATGNGDPSGNGVARIAFPSSHPHAMAVGASNDQGRRSRYSNYGKGLEFVAPSSDFGRPGITTTDVARKNRGFSLGSAYTNVFGGTSSATPLAAGIAALVLSVNPKLTWTEVRQILRSTADKIDSRGGNYKNGVSAQYGHGRLNAAGAVAAAQTSLTRPPAPASKKTPRRPTSPKGKSKANTKNTRRGR
jgi:subtilisin family serine protease